MHQHYDSAYISPVACKGGIIENAIVQQNHENLGFEKRFVHLFLGCWNEHALLQVLLELDLENPWHASCLQG